MKCSAHGCPGQYERRPIVHTVKRGDQVLVFEDVPAQICDVCSDSLLEPETIERLERMIRLHATPQKYAPVYTYA